MRGDILMKILVKVILVIILITSLSSDEITLLNPIIPDFQVNENGVLSVARQESPAICADSSGNYIIVWDDRRNGYFDIYAQRYSNDGTALGSNFKVNDDIGSTWRLNPSISADVKGNFIIVWRDTRNGNSDIYAQRFASDGSALGSNFKVNNDIGSEGQSNPSISVNSSGNYIIVWDDERNGYSDIYAQLYSKDGTALESNFKVNDDQGSDRQNYPSISVDGSGNFFIVWQDNRNGNDDIYAQRFACDGIALGSNFKVNDDQGSERQNYPSISADGSGYIIITWYDVRNSDGDIYAQRYSGDGTTLGTNFQVNDDIVSAWQCYPSISADGSGNFIISWIDARNDNIDIYVQRYSSNGIALGINYMVNDDQGSERQNYPSISADDSGNFIITWQDGRNIYTEGDIYAQRYSNDGTALENNFKVNDDIGSEGQGSAAISVDDSGNFIIVWDDERNGFENGDIYAQRYSMDGIAQGSNFKVNDDQDYTHQSSPSFSMDGSGNFIITWEDGRNGTSDIYAQRYSSDGTVQGSNFKVNNDQLDESQTQPCISVDDSGNFIIAWVDRENDDIYAQRYSSDGTAQGSNFMVNDDQGDTWQYEPSISVDGNGNIIITWEDGRDPVDGCWGYTNIYAQRYSGDGIKLGSNFKVNDDQDCVILYDPSISADSSGNFIIAWINYSETISDIYAQRYSSDGTTLGSNFRVNDDQARNAWQWWPSVSANENGNFIITWDDRRNDNWDIYAQQYSSDGKTVGSNFRVIVTSGGQGNPEVKLWNNRIYNAWNDNRAGETAFDIWANVLDWNDPDGINDNELYQIPLAFVLHQNYPNPFNPSTTIEFSLPKSEFVTLKVYNILGEEIATVVHDKLQAGNHTYQFDGSNLASGVYLYRIEAGEYNKVMKMILIK